MSFRIEKILTPYNFTNRNNVKRIKYIVIHYFGSLGTAAAVANWFARGFRGASAHYILDEGDIIYQSVEDEDVAWHCGTSGTFYHAECRNSNSLGIEVRPHKLNTASLKATDTDWYFKPEVVDRLVLLTKELMKKYNIPVDNVLRHYDVTRKICPNPFVIDAKAVTAWDTFKKRLVEPTPISHRVRVNAIALNIRKGPGTQHHITGVITDRGVYTVVDIRNGWGMLKSGAGWISLNFTTRL